MRVYKIIEEKKEYGSSCNGQTDHGVWGMENGVWNMEYSEDCLNGDDERNKDKERGYGKKKMGRKEQNRTEKQFLSV